MKDELFDDFMARVSYCGDTGAFVWTDAKFVRGRAGEAAGSIDAWGYVIISANRHRVKAHRLAWRVMTGQWPTGVIDHINGNRADNRFSNLREVTPAGNRQNQQKVRSDSTTGVQGVRQVGRLYAAYVRVNGRRIRMGGFPTAALAHAAYLTAKRLNHSAFAG